MRSNVVKCSECGGMLIKFSGEGFNVKDDSHFRLTFGRVCRRCEIIFLNPAFKDFEQKISHLGDERVEVKTKED